MIHSPGHRFARWAAVLVMVGAAGCTRSSSLEPPPDNSITGYRIEGSIKDEFLHPLVGVDVAVFYDLSFAGGDSVSRTYTPFDPLEPVALRVQNEAGQFVRILFNGVPPDDMDLYIEWDRRDDSGALVKNGIYTVGVFAGSTVRKSYQMIIDGHVTTTTDASGHFVIDSSELPIGQKAPFYDSSDQFEGQFELTNVVYLRFIAPPFMRTISVELVKDKVTMFSRVLN